jgi:hypothetical protein
MTDLATLANALPMPIKIGWAVWLIWAAVLVEWYCRGRSMRIDPRSQPHTAADGRPNGTGREHSAGNSSSAGA